MPGGEAAPEYAVTLERGTDGTYLGWVDELPGCAVRARSRDDALAHLPATILDFLAQGGITETAATPAVVVVDEVESAIETEEDTEVLLEADRHPLSPEDWKRARNWLAHSRTKLEEILRELTDEQLDAKRQGSHRSIREEIEHIAFVADRWTPRKAVRRLVWHELLHVRPIERFASRSPGSTG